MILIFRAAYGVLVLTTLLLSKVVLAGPAEMIVCIKTDGKTISMMKHDGSCIVKELTALGKIVVLKRSTDECDQIRVAYKVKGIGQGCE